MPFKMSISILSNWDSIFIYFCIFSEQNVTVTVWRRQSFWIFFQEKALDDTVTVPLIHRSSLSCRSLVGHKDFLIGIFVKLFPLILSEIGSVFSSTAVKAYFWKMVFLTFWNLKEPDSTRVTWCWEIMWPSKGKDKTRFKATFQIRIPVMIHNSWRLKRLEDIYNPRKVDSFCENFLIRVRKTNLKPKWHSMMYQVSFSR